MCTVSVKVDEEMLRGVLPELENTAAIRRWAQMLIDARIHESSDEALHEPLQGSSSQYLRPHT